MNLDGSGFRQLTHDGTFKFLPHLSPDATLLKLAANREIERRDQ